MNVDTDVEQLELSLLGNVNCFNRLGKLSVYTGAKHIPILWPSNFTHLGSLKINEYICP